MRTALLFRKRLLACMVGPHLDDAALFDFAAGCRRHEVYISGVIVNLCQVSIVAPLLEGMEIEVVAPVAYPLGNLPTELKSIQVEQAVRDGATGIAAVMKGEALRAGDYEEARRDAAAVAAARGEGRASLALIANSASLPEAQALEAARIARELGAVYVTNAGFGMQAKPHHVRAIRDAFGDDLRIIAAGGIRTADEALEYLRLGASGIASSRPFELIDEIEKLPADEAPA